MEAYRIGPLRWMEDEGTCEHCGCWMYRADPFFRVYDPEGEFVAGPFDTRTCAVEWCEGQGVTFED